VARYPISRLQVSGHRFLARRLERAVLHGDTASAADSVRGQSVSLGAGALLAVLLVVGCAVLGWLRPQPGLGDAAIVLDRVSGALYVRVDDILHPVLNLTSARLIAQAADDPRQVAGADLATAKRGPLLGIPGAPGSIDAALSAAEAGWTACDGAVTTVIAGPLDPAGVVSPLTAGEPVLVSSRSGTTYLLYDGRRAVVDLTDAVTVRALHLDGVAPRPVSQAVLSIIPEAPPIAAPVIPAFGGHGPQALPGFLVGDVVRVQRATETGSGSDYFVVLAGGVQRVGLVAAELIQFATARAGTETTAVAPSAIRQVPTVAVLPVSEFPDRIDAPVGNDVPVLCASWAAGAVSVSTGGGLPLGDHQVPVTLAQSDGDGPAVDAVFIPPGRSGYVRPAGSAAPVGSVVADTGVRFAVGDADDARVLGLPERPEPAPWSLLVLLPSGPELRRAAALVARDGVALSPP
jgi:type VII secretion protein EccB